MALFAADDGKAALLVAVCCGPALLPAFWLEGAGHYRMPARAALGRCWLVFRLIFSGMGLLTGVSTVLLLTIDVSEKMRVGVGVLSISCLMCGLLPTPNNRRLVRARLSRLSQTPEERRAAAVAALVGHVSRARVEALGEEAFRVLPWAVLSESHWASSGDTGLGKHAYPAALGECDAFISHSWHDPATSKWEALQVWASDFRQTHARDPVVW